MGFFYDDPAEHPDALDLEIAGKSVPFLLNNSAFGAAKSEGIDFAEFSDLEDDDVAGNMEALASLLYVGTIPFDRETPTKEELDEALTPRIASQIGPEVMAQFEGLEDEEIEEVVGKE